MTSMFEGSAHAFTNAMIHGDDVKAELEGFGIVMDKERLSATNPLASVVQSTRFFRPHREMDATSISDTVRTMVVVTRGVDVRVTGSENEIATAASMLLLGEYRAKSERDDKRLRDQGKTVVDMGKERRDLERRLVAQDEAIVRLWDALGKKRRQRFLVLTGDTTINKAIDRVEAKEANDEE